jgi:hypothetical protein
MRARPVPIERLRDDLPPGLGSLVLRCMNPDPRLRVADAQALLDEIDALAIAPWTHEEALRWWKERAAAVIGARGPAGARGASPRAITVDTARLSRSPEVRAARAQSTTVKSAG